MLVLGRKPGQSLRIGDGITVTVLEVKGDMVRIGVEAPREVPVHRTEVYEAIKKENRAAAMIKRDILASLPDKK